MTEPMHPEIKQLYEKYFDKCFAAFAKEQGEPVAYLLQRQDREGYETGEKTDYGAIPVYRHSQLTWPALMRGVRVEGDTVVISVKDNDAARELCGALIEEMNK